jgi:hypothetical protein
MDAYAVAAFLLLVAVVYLIVRPLATRSPKAPEVDVSALRTERERLLDAIRELDMDLATGKLAADDHRVLRARYAASAADAMQALDAAQAAIPATEPATAVDALAEAVAGGGADGGQAAVPAAVEDELELEITALREVVRPPGDTAPLGAVGGGGAP